VGSLVREPFACASLTQKQGHMGPCLLGLVRRPCASKAFRKIGRPYATKTLHKTLACEKPYALSGLLQRSLV